MFIKKTLEVPVNMIKTNENQPRKDFPAMNSSRNSEIR